MGGEEAAAPHMTAYERERQVDQREGDALGLRGVAGAQLGREGGDPIEDPAVAGVGAFGLLRRPVTPAERLGAVQQPCTYCPNTTAPVRAAP
ncbi:hypothetical protein [Streptomyces albidochromogenes]|uniref:Uncharacterized protein n=1 Tax=Streptomyces albidochromogenes TaxID=329524 RepID=A0ABW6FH62_9ACTN